MRKKRNLALDVLADMSDTWSDRTSAMLSIVLAMAAHTTGHKSVSICLDDVGDFLADHDIEKQYGTLDGRNYLYVSYTRKSLPAPTQQDEGDKP